GANGVTVTNGTEANSWVVTWNTTGNRGTLISNKTAVVVEQEPCVVHGDRIDAGDGNDYISGGAGEDKLIAGIGNDWIDGGADSDRLQGQAGDDVIIGGAGDDNLLGGLGADVLVGGAGNDSIGWNGSNRSDTGAELGADGIDPFIAGGDGTDSF